MFDIAFFTNNLGRFLGSQPDHSKPCFYYLLKLPELFWPWLPLLPFALYRALRHFRSIAPGERLALLALLMPFVLLSIASAKRVVYLLPLYAPCALLCAGWAVDTGAKFAEKALHLRVFSRWRRTFAPLAAALLAVMFALSLGVGAAAALYPALAIALLIAACLVKRPTAAFRLGLMTLALGFASIDTTSEYFIRHDSLEPLFAEIAAIGRSGKETAYFDAPERTLGGAYYYLHRKLPEYHPDSMKPLDEMYIILRDNDDETLKDEARPFADSHWLLPPRVRGTNAQ